jgi:putative tryptophan/tyrosine transport system substrate-binding protein
MTRREFMRVLCGAGLAWPLAARAQQPNRVRRIGALMAYAASDPEGQSRGAAFEQGLKGWGWADGHNLRIDYRWPGGDLDQIRTFAKELVSMAPDAILGGAPRHPALTARPRR